MMICDICVFDLYGTHTRTWTGKSGNTYRKAVLVLVVVVYWMLLSVVPLSLSPTELAGPPNTLHTDRPYISSSTWAQAAPACSGGVSPCTVCHADGRALQAWAVTLAFPLSICTCTRRAMEARPRLCAAVGGALRRPHMIAADVFPAHSPHTPYPLPDVDHSTLATTQRMLLTLRAYPTVEDELSARPPAYE